MRSPHMGHRRCVCVVRALARGQPVSLPRAGMGSAALVAPPAPCCKEMLFRAVCYIQYR